MGPRLARILELIGEEAHDYEFPVYAKVRVSRLCEVSRYSEEEVVSAVQELRELGLIEPGEHDILGSENVWKLTCFTRELIPNAEVVG